MTRAENLIGKTSAEVVTHLAKTHPDIATFTLGHYENIPGGSSGRQLGMTHWEEVPWRKIVVPGWDAAAERLLPRENQTLAICSPVRLENGTTKHILMLDIDSLEPYYNSKTGEFVDRGPDEVIKAARELVKNLADLHYPPGCILFSGHGLHFIGLHLVKEDDFQPLAWQVVDKHHDGNWSSYAHQYGFFALRLNIGKHKIMVPRVVLIFKPNYAPNRYKEHLDYEIEPHIPWWQDAGFKDWEKSRTENPIFTNLPDKE